MSRKLWAAVLTAVTAVGFLPMLAVGPAAHAATNEGLKLATSVSNEPIVPDPGPAAYVRYTLKATNGGSTPAANAAVKLSNAKRTATFHTNGKGILTLVEPVDVNPGDGAPALAITANVTARTGATASATQQIYSGQMTVVCSFPGKPSADSSLLEAMVPDVLGDISPSAIQTLISTLVELATPFHTDAAGYKITVPGARDIYAQTVQITRRSKGTYYSGTGYSRKPILQAGDILQQIQTNCTATSGLS
jgi:hypothetical protein